MSATPVIFANNRRSESQIALSRHALFLSLLMATTSHTRSLLVAARVFEWAEDERPFGSPSTLAARYRFVKRVELRSALIQFCEDTGLCDPESVEVMSANNVVHTSLEEFIDKRRYYAPRHGRDATGDAAAAFMAAVALPMLFDMGSSVRNAPIDVPLVARVLVRGADGIFKLAREQFRSLAQMTVDLVDWLVRERAGKVVVIESPLGNSVPVAVLREVAAVRGLDLGVVEWGCPRNDRAVRGHTVIESAKHLAVEPRVAAANLLLFVDDAITGSRFLKMATALRKAAGEKRVGAIAMRARYNPAAGYLVGQVRDLEIVKRWAADGGLPFGVWELPDMPIFQIDDCDPALMETALAWGDASLTAGKRKNNIIFYFIDRFEAIAKDLATPGLSASRDFLTRYIWHEDQSGRRFITPPEIAEQAFTQIIGKLPIDFFASIRESAKAEFPHDFYGRAIAGEDAVRCRTDWLAGCIYQAASKVLNEVESHFLNRAIQNLSTAGWTAGVNAPPRDHDYGLYTIPLPMGEDLLHQHLVALIVADAATLAPNSRAACAPSHHSFPAANATPEFD